MKFFRRAPRAACQEIVRESTDGKRLILNTLGPETFFGEMALTGERFLQNSTAEALDDALVCVPSRRDLERLILEHPKVGLRFFAQISARFLETELIVEDFAFRSAPARLAGVLPRPAETSEIGTIQASHQELADMIASYRETVTLTLDQFQDRGLVELDAAAFESLTRSRYKRCPRREQVIASWGAEATAIKCRRHAALRRCHVAPRCRARRQ